MLKPFNLFLGVICLFPLIIPFSIIAFLIKVTSRGPVLHKSRRVGVNGKVFLMPKFRTMSVDTPEVATHLLQNPEQFITPLGRFLRKYSLDELPQIISILKGEMAFVGPRPALYNQEDLIKLREENDIHKLLPGITGWAQVNGRDELTIIEKVEYDEEYLKRASVSFDIYIIWLTIIKVIKRDDILH